MHAHSRIQAVLFDKDGTLIDFDATFAPATRLVIDDLSAGDAALAGSLCAAADFDASTATIAPGSVLIAGSLGDIATVWAPYLSLSIEDLIKQIDRLYVKYSRETVTAFPFTEASLDALRDRNLSLGIATNDSEEGARSHMAHLSLGNRFDHILGCDSGHGGKPEPGMVRAFADRLGLEPHSVAMVGDSLHDCVAGRSAGALVIAVTSGRADPETLSPQADFVLDDISQLPDLLDSLNGAA